MLWSTNGTLVMGINYDNSTDCTGHIGSRYSKEFDVGNECWEFDGRRFSGATSVEVGTATNTTIATQPPTNPWTPSPSVVSGAVCTHIILSLCWAFVILFYAM